MGREVTVRLIQVYVMALHGAGVDASAALAKAGIDAKSLFDGSARISHLQLVHFWKHAESLAQDPELSLRSVEVVDGRIPVLRTQLTEYTVLHLFANSATVAEGVQRYADACALQHTLAEMRVTACDGDAEVSLVFHATPPAPASLVEYCLAVLGRVLRATTGGQAMPTEVFLKRPEEPEARVWLERRFGCPVHLGSDRDALRLGKRDLARPLETANLAILKLAIAQAAPFLEGAQDKHVLVGRVTSLVSSELSLGRMSAGHVAEQLGLSLRTFSRRLRDAGTSYTELLDRVRSQQAAQLLAGDNLEPSEIATMLGFADLKTFERASRRWFGASPTQHRKSVRR